MIINNVSEIWKPVKNYKGIYEISNLGRLKSVSRIITTKANVKKHIKEKILNPQQNNTGYKCASLMYQNKQKKRLIHQLVAEAFLDSKYLEKGLVVDHVDNNRLNNNLNNLQIITYRENLSKDAKNKYSNFTGVTWHKKDKKWQTQINLKGKNIYLGQYNCEQTASKVYQQALKKSNKK